jgi:hypothetical protein
VGESGHKYRLSGIMLNLEFDFQGILEPNWRASNRWYRRKGTNSLTESVLGACTTPYQKARKRSDCIDLSEYHLPGGKVPVMADVKVKVVPGWSSLGSRQTYDNPDWDAQAKNSVLSRYMRGIRFTYTGRGRVSVFDWYHLINQIAVASVLMGFAPVLTGLVAFSCLPESKVYKFSQKSPINITREYSRFSANSVLMMFLFKSLASGSGEEGGDDDAKKVGGRITEEDMSNMMCTYMDKSMAAQIADSVMRNGDKYQPGGTEVEVVNGHGEPYEGHHGKKNYLTFAEFLEVVTDDTMSLAMLREGLEVPEESFSDGEDGDGEIAVTKPKRNVTARASTRTGRALPEPYQHWAQKKSPDGRVYFSNRREKRTQWSDPRD